MLAIPGVVILLTSSVCTLETVNANTDVYFQVIHNAQILCLPILSSLWADARASTQIPGLADRGLYSGYHVGAVNWCAL